MKNNVRVSLKNKKRKKSNYFVLSMVVFLIVTFAGFVCVNNAMSDLLIMDKNPKIKISLEPFEISVKTEKYHIYINSQTKDNYINFINKIFGFRN